MNRFNLFIFTTIGALLAASSYAAEPPVSPTEEKETASDISGDRSSFLRVVESDNRMEIGLEIATRWYEEIEGKETGGTGGSPLVALVGVAHIGEREFYEDLQELLDTFEVVLYESVRPAGAASPVGATDEERRAATLASLRFLGAIAETHQADRGNYPGDFDDLAAYAGTLDDRLGSWVERITHDAWKHPLLYMAGDEGTSFTLTSFGADGLPEGEGAAGDIVVSDQDRVRPIPGKEEKEEGNIQGQLAAALGLAFQLEALDYGRGHFRVSDMTIDQVERAFAARGEDFSLVGDMLAGSSLPAKIISLMLRLMKWLDTLMERALADTFKVVLIELLGDESVLELSTAQFGDAFAEVIIGERNQVVIDDLEEIIRHDPGVKSVAIFYGAAHLPDLEERLAKRLGYTLTERVEWRRAIGVDLEQSAVSRREVARIRVMVKRMIRQMQRGNQ